MNEVYWNVEVKDSFYRIRLSAIEGIRTQPWRFGEGKDEELGESVSIMFQNWGITCQMNDPGVIGLIKFYNDFGYQDKNNDILGDENE